MFILEFFVPTILLFNHIQYTFKENLLDNFLVENCVQLNIKMPFSSELEMKNWLIDNGYKKQKEQNDFCLYELPYNILAKPAAISNKNYILAIWKKV